MALNLYTLTLNWNVAGQFASNILHYNFDDGGYNTTAEAGNALVQRWITVSRGAWLNMLPNVTSLLSVKGRKATGVGGFEAAAIMAAGVVGTRAGEISASGINPVLIHYPVNAIRGRGKTFLPGLREADANGGVFTANFTAAVEANKATAFSDLVLVGGGGPTATFRVRQRNPPGSSWAVLDTFLSDQIGQQRRRQRPF